MCICSKFKHFSRQRFSRLTRNRCSRTTANSSRKSGSGGHTVTRGAGSKSTQAEPLATLLVFTQKAMSQSSPKFDLSVHLDSIKQFIPVELSVLACLIVIILTMFIVICMRRRITTKRHKSLLTLAINAETSHLTFNVIRLNYNPEHYRVLINRQRVQIKLTSMMLFYILEYTDGINILNLPLNLMVGLRKSTVLSLWSGRILNKILKGSHTASLEFFDTNNRLVEIVMLTENRLGSAMVEPMTVPITGKLYPTL